MKQHSEFKPVIWNVERRTLPPECARAPFGLSVSSYLFTDAWMLPKPCRSSDAAQSSSSSRFKAFLSPGLY